MVSIWCRGVVLSKRLTAKVGGKSHGKLDGERRNRVWRALRKRPEDIRGLSTPEKVKEEGKEVADDHVSAQSEDTSAKSLGIEPVRNGEERSEVRALNQPETESLQEECDVVDLDLD